MGHSSKLCDGDRDAHQRDGIDKLKYIQDPLLGMGGTMTQS